MELLSILGHSQPPQRRTVGQNFKRLKLKVILLTLTFGRGVLSGNDSLKRKSRIVESLQSAINRANNERTPEEKMKFVEKELLRVLQGQGSIMACPYCFGLNVKPADPDNPEPLCCRMFAMASIAAMSAQEIQENLDKAAKLADRIHG